MSSWRTCITRTRRSCHLESQSSRSWPKRSATSSTSKTRQSETKERNRQQTSRSQLHRDSTRTTMKNSSQNQNGTIWTFQTTRSWMTKKMTSKNRRKRLVSISLRWSQCVPSAEVKSLTNTWPRAATTAVWPVGGRWGATWWTPTRTHPMIHYPNARSAEPESSSSSETQRNILCPDHSSSTILRHS